MITIISQKHLSVKFNHITFLDLQLDGTLKRKWSGWTQFTPTHGAFQNPMQNYLSQLNMVGPKG